MLQFSLFSGCGQLGSQFTLLIGGTVRILTEVNLSSKLVAPSRLAHHDVYGGDPEEEDWSGGLPSPVDSLGSPCICYASLVIHTLWWRTFCIGPPEQATLIPDLTVPVLSSNAISFIPVLEGEQVTGCCIWTPLPISDPNGGPGLPFLWHLLTAWGPEDHEPKSPYKRSQGISLGSLGCLGHTDLDARWIRGRFFLRWRGKLHLQVKPVTEGLASSEKDFFESSCCIQRGVTILQLVNSIYEGPTGLQMLREDPEEATGTHLEIQIWGIYPKERRQMCKDM